MTSKPLAAVEGTPEPRKEFPWTIETMRIINDMTPDIKGKAFDPDWFLLRNRLEEFERLVPVSAPVPSPTPKIPDGWFIYECQCGDQSMHRLPPKFCARCGFNYESDELAAPVPEPKVEPEARKDELDDPAPGSFKCPCCACPWRQCVHDDCSECGGKRLNVPPQPSPEAPAKPRRLQLAEECRAEAANWKGQRFESTLLKIAKQLEDEKLAGLSPRLKEGHNE